MARLPALVDALALTDRRGRATVEQMARIMRAAGLIERTKRGRGAGHVGLVDAATMLIGLNGTERLKDAPAAVEAFRNLVPFDRSKLTNPPSFAACLTDVENFGAAVERLIGAAPSLLDWSIDHAVALFAAQGASVYDLIKGGASAFDLSRAGAAIRIDLTMPDRVGTITISPGSGPGADESPGFQAQFASAVKSPGWAILVEDRQVTASIGIETLMNVHDVFGLSGASL